VLSFEAYHTGIIVASQQVLVGGVSLCPAPHSLSLWSLPSWNVSSHGSVQIDILCTKIRQGSLSFMPLYSLVLLINSPPPFFRSPHFLYFTPLVHRSYGEIESRYASKLQHDSSPKGHETKARLLHNGGCRCCLCFQYRCVLQPSIRIKLGMLGVGL
jgi:hypothetical protein